MLYTIILGAGAGLFVGFFVGAITGGGYGIFLGMILGLVLAPVGAIIAVKLESALEASIKRDAPAVRQITDDDILPNIRLLVLCVGSGFVLSLMLDTYLYMKSIDFELTSWITEQWWSQQVQELPTHLIVAVLLGWPAFRYFLGRSRDQR